MRSSSPLATRATPFVPWGTPITGQLPGVPAGRQHRRRAGAAGRHAPRRHALLPAFHKPAPRSGSRRGLLVVNHEYTDESYLHNGTAAAPAKELDARDGPQVPGRPRRLA